jgi:outer membrane cobalamin receptor
MTSRAFLRASLIALGVSAALGANSAWAQDADTPAPADTERDASGEELSVITVTGSRTITDVLKSPTPITSVDIATIAATTPSDTADALNKLPSILGGRTPRNQGNGANNNGGNTLSLRNFGASRTLVLLDGHRVAPNNQDGSVNIDVLPQMLVKQVDIVTGRASAVQVRRCPRAVVGGRVQPGSSRRSRSRRRWPGRCRRAVPRRRPKGSARRGRPGRAS